MNYKKLVELAEDTIEHKKLVLDNCLKMAKHLMENDQIQLGIDLLKRGCEHDNSKFSNGEFKALAKILTSRKCFTDAGNKLSNEEVKAIELHWKHNKHHPEYFDSSEDMSELDMVEMVCDWYARSIQYNTDFLGFVTERQSNRFHFRDDQFDKIIGYCKILKDLENGD